MAPNDMLEPHLSPIAIQLSAQDALLKTRQELIVQIRNLQGNKLFTHDSEILGSPGIVQARKTLADKLADNLTHLLHRTLNCGIVRCRGENLLELGHRVVRGNGGAFSLTKQGVDVEAGERLDGLLTTASALRFGWNCLPGQYPWITRNNLAGMVHTLFDLGSIDQCVDFGLGLLEKFHRRLRESK